MVGKGNHALSIVEDSEFKNLIEMITHCPGYKLPTRKSLSNSLLPNVYNELKAKLHEEIRLASAVCLSTDAWTSRANQSYIAVTAHFVEPEKGILKSHLIACIENAERHTSDNLCATLRKIMDEWEISNKITAVVSDNAANIIGAIKIGQWRSVPCFAHTLNLIVQKGLQQLDSIKIKSKAIAEFFHRSANGLQKLMETQKQLNMPELKLKIDVQTRWNSTYEMFDRLLKVKDALNVVLSRLKPDLCMTHQEWAIIEEIVPVLKPFYEVSTELSAEQNVTLSKVKVQYSTLDLKGVVSKMSMHTKAQ
ncbi:zinc finger BED domain-containing protein 1-like [Rhagoletis pomonella]|uniref:zinc finger BED domain-containing protein 1-like n=1 Tax=Rhagoletis pomonella TaxID=28610 RepID=UPI00178753C0|nr:zinc finger BED domain-containing protein 1-like [Rhagoletis pomonella]